MNHNLLLGAGLELMNFELLFGVGLAQKKLDGGVCEPRGNACVCDEDRHLSGIVLVSVLFLDVLREQNNVNRSAPEPAP